MKRRTAPKPEPAPQRHTTLMNCQITQNAAPMNADSAAVFVALAEAAKANAEAIAKIAQAATSSGGTFGHAVHVN